MSLFGPSGTYFNSQDGIELKFYEKNILDNFKKAANRSQLVKIDINGFDTVVTTRSTLKSYIKKQIKSNLEGKQVSAKVIKGLAGETMKFIGKYEKLDNIVLSTAEFAKHLV